MLGFYFSSGEQEACVDARLECSVARGHASVAAGRQDWPAVIIENARKPETLSLAGVNGTLSTSASLGFLLGDVNNSRTVSQIDISALQARAGQVTDLSNFRFDVNASGSINASDIAAAKARLGAVLQ